MPRGAGPRESCSLPPVSPHLPGSFSGSPEIIQERVFAQGVHRLPEAGMLESSELAFRGQALQRFALENGLRFLPEVIPDPLGVKDHESAIDESFACLGFLIEIPDQSVIHAELAKTA